MFKTALSNQLQRQPKSLGASFKMGILPLRRAPLNWKNSKVLRGQNRAIAAEYRPGLGSGWVFTAEPIPPAPRNHVQAWHLTGHHLCPTGVGNEVVLIDSVVPNGVSMVLNGHYQYIEDGGASIPANTEEMFIWYLRVGGKDLLNPFSSTVATGRLIRANNTFIPFGPLREDLPVLSAGTPFQYVVKGSPTLNLAGQAQPTLAATLFATLWGDKSQ